MTPISWLLITVFLGLTSAGLLVAAPSHVAAANGVTITTNKAEAKFPDGVLFSIAGTATAPISRLELYYAVAEYPVTNLAIPARDVPETFESEYLVDLRVNYVPPGVDFEYYWRFLFADGTTFETEQSTVLWFDTRFDWQSVESPFLRVYSYAGGEEFRQHVLQVGDEAIEDLMAAYGISELSPVRLWLYKTPEDFQAARVENSHEFVAGTASILFQVIIAVVSENDEYELGRVVPHELSHQVLYQAARNPYNSPPLWMDEGLAVFAQPVGAGDSLQRVTAAAENGSLPPARSLISEFPYEIDARILAYASSYSLIVFINDRWGSEGISNLINAYHHGVTHDEALSEAFDVTYVEFDALWREWVKSQ